MRAARSRILVTAVAGGLLMTAPVSVQALAPVPADPPAAASAFTPADPNLRVTFYLGLERDEQGAARQLKLRSNPKSAYYRHWLTPAQSARDFGASPATVKAVKSYLAKRGIVTKVDKSRILARITGTVADLERTFGTRIEEQVVQNVRFVQAHDPAVPQAPAAIRSQISEVLFSGQQQLTDSPVQVQMQGAPRSNLVAAPQNAGTPVGACETVKNDPNTMTYAQAAKAYTVDKVRKRLGYGTKKGDATVKAPRVGIISMGDGFSQRAADTAAQCLGRQAAPSRVVKTDGMLTRLAEGPEGNLDQQMISAMLGRTSRISTYEAINFTNATYLPYLAALNDPKLPPVLSTSYGGCEAWLVSGQDKLVGQLTESVLLRLGLVGTTVFVSAGDTGSSSCAEEGKGDQLGVEYPASSPYVVAVGGSRLVLDQANRRVDEVVWNDSDFTGGNFALIPGSNDGAGGGGTSSLFKRPWWQTKQTGSTTRRTVPDVTAHASGAPGWPVFFESASLGPVTLDNQWFGVWGTSSSAPLTAATFAMIVAKERTAGRPKLGPVNPWLYSVKQPYAKGFFDVVSGDNDLFDQGCCSAKKGYDRASGIGVPKFADLQRSLPKVG